MKIKIEITEAEVKELIVKYIQSKFDEEIDENRIDVLVKSKQNYKSEWENAAIKVEYERNF